MYCPLQEGSGDTFNKLFDIAMGTVAAGTSNGKKDTYSYSSIAKAASKLVAVFPILASRTMSVDTTRMVSKYIEQRACQLFMLALQSMNISTAQNGIEYLRTFHQNIDIGGAGSNEAIIKAMGAWIDAYNDGKAYAGKMHENSLSANHPGFGAMDDWSHLLECDSDLQISGNDLKELMKLMEANANIQVYDTQLNPRSINDFVVNESYGNYTISIKPLEEATKRSPQDQLEHQEDRDRARHNWNRQLKREEEEDQEKEDRSERDRRQKELDQKSQYNDIWDKDTREKKKYGATPAKVAFMKDQDIKKMNDAVPSLLVVRFYQTSGENDKRVIAGVATEFIIGVKSKIVAVDTAEILRRIMNDNKDGQKFLKLMRTLTGELKASELILGLSRIKDDLASTRKKGAYGDTWELLKNRAIAAKQQIRSGKNNDFSAITTVAISQADADELYREENLDISNPRVARRFMSSYNIMAFIIADDSTESLKIMMDDGDNSFEELSYRQLQKETGNEDYKKLINLMAASR